MHSGRRPPGRSSRAAGPGWHAGAVVAGSLSAAAVRALSPCPTRRPRDALTATAEVQRRRSSALSNCSTVAIGTSPTMVIHQSPRRCITVFVAPMVVRMP